MNRCPGSVITPAGEVVVHRFALRQVMGQIFPAATGAEDVEYGVDDLACIHDARAAPLVSGQERFEDLPLSIGQVTRVRLAYRTGASECLV